jgi:rod shape-determining protein MreB and related proteins
MVPDYQCRGRRQRLDRSSTSERFGSNQINDVIATHLRRHRGLQVGEETTELLKTSFVTTFLPDDISKTIEVRGRDVQTGSPAAVEVTTASSTRWSKPSSAASHNS